MSAIYFEVLSQPMLAPPGKNGTETKTEPNWRMLQIIQSLPVLNFKMNLFCWEYKTNQSKQPENTSSATWHDPAGEWMEHNIFGERVVLLKHWLKTLFRELKLTWLQEISFSSPPLISSVHFGFVVVCHCALSNVQLWRQLKIMFTFSVTSCINSN